MAQRVQQRITTKRPGQRLWLAVLEGEWQPAPPEAILPADGPEAPLEIEFVGLSPMEQRAALAGFPGGRRFVLKPS